MIANNIAAFNEGRFHRNIVTIPQARDSNDLNPYSMLTRAQARRKSGEMILTEPPAALNAAARVFITNKTLKSSRRNIHCHGMREESMRQLRYPLTIISTYFTDYYSLGSCIIIPGVRQPLQQSSRAIQSFNMLLTKPYQSLLQAREGQERKI